MYIYIYIYTCVYIICVYIYIYIYIYMYMGGEDRRPRASRSGPPLLARATIIMYIFMLTLL